jgi:hypothetical protein
VLHRLLAQRARHELERDLRAVPAVRELRPQAVEVERVAAAEHDGGPLAQLLSITHAAKIRGVVAFHRQPRLVALGGSFGRFGAPKAGRASGFPLHADATVRTLQSFAAARRFAVVLGLRLARG